MILYSELSHGALRYRLSSHTLPNRERSRQIEQPIPLLIELRSYVRDRNSEQCKDFLEFCHNGNVICRLKAGFTFAPGKGRHTKWFHPLLPGKLTLSGKDGDDAKRYQEQDVNNALQRLKEIEQEEEDR